MFQVNASVTYIFMSGSSPSTHDRLIQAALELFLSQGIQNTTTRQIANLAEVNEVTLFRNFGNKYGLLQAVIEESPLFGEVGETLRQVFRPTATLQENLHQYVQSCLQLLEQKPDFVRSLIGEAEQYSPELRQVLAQKLLETQQTIAQTLAQSLKSFPATLPPEKLLYLINGMLLAYGITAFTSGTERFWQDRESFLKDLVQFCTDSIQSAPGSPTLSLQSPIVQVARSLPTISDLPANLVHEILQRSRKQGLLDHAIAYLLFGAGLTPTEISGLLRTQQISNPQQHIVQVVTANGMRSVSVNQWILGRRYGSYTNNPLTRWLRSRKDQNVYVFLGEEAAPIAPDDITKRWCNWVEGLVTPEGKAPTIEQAQQTWTIEMLMRGVSLENLSILTGLEIEHLQPYAHRAREKAALEQAVQLDQKGKGNATAKS
jgi:AcrR family transcriptional regulator